MNHILWHTASRKDAAQILCGGTITSLMKEGPYGYGLYLQFEPQPPDDVNVRMQFELSEDIDLTCRGVGWDAVDRIPVLNPDMMIGDAIVDQDGQRLVCVYNSKKVRLILIAC